MKKINLKHFLTSRKYRFIFFGTLNLLISNLIIQFLLLLIPPVFATFFGQIVNFFIGFYLYSFKVFDEKEYRFSCFVRYITLNIFLWNTNWILIESISSYGFSKNIVSLFLIPFLASISYLAQKYFVFNKK